MLEWSFQRQFPEDVELCMLYLTSILQLVHVEKALIRTHGVL